MKTAQLIAIDGTTTEISPAHGHHFKLQELYFLLGCRYIEIAHLDDGRLMIIDEEGKLKAGHRINQKATDMYRPSVDYIVGRALVCDASMLET